MPASRPFFVVLIALVLVISLAGCAAPTAAPATAASQNPIADAPTSTARPTDTPLPPPTGTPAPTDTPTPEPTATDTPEPTATATPESELFIRAVARQGELKPGIYGIGGRCVTTSTARTDLEYETCLFSAWVAESGNINLQFSWTLIDTGWFEVYRNAPSKRTVGIYLIDEFGNEYVQQGISGPASNNMMIHRNEPVMGTFAFAPAKPGAHIFTYYDGASLPYNTEIQIDNLRFTEPEAYPVYSPLKNSANQLYYSYPEWTPSLAGAGLAFDYPTIPNCRVEELPAGTPEGKLKNQLQIGEITYNIYAVNETAPNVTFREYMAIDGLPGLDPAAAPRFKVTLPAEKPDKCLNMLAGFLSALMPVK